MADELSCCLHHESSGHWTRQGSEVHASCERRETVYLWHQRCLVLLRRKERKIELAEGVFETIPQYVAAVWNCYVAYCGERAMHCACWWTRQRRVNGV